MRCDGSGPSIHVTPATTDRPTAQRWFDEFEGAGLDGVVAKPLTITYQPDKRIMFKIKHERTADCVVAGYRVHKSGGDAIGSLLLGLYQDDGQLASVGVIGAFPMAERRRLFTELQPLVTGFDDHPWNWAAHEAGERTPRKNEFSRWNAGKDLSFVPLRPERVVEVRYDHMEGRRFRHTAQFNRWRPDRDPRSCTYEQLEQPLTFSLGDIVPGLVPGNGDHEPVVLHVAALLVADDAMLDDGSATVSVRECTQKPVFHRTFAHARGWEMRLTPRRSAPTARAA